MNEFDVHSKRKMVVLITSAIAIGISAIAACVVPWIYCKSKKDPPDDREGTAIEDVVDLVSHTLSATAENSSSTLGVRINCRRGQNLVRVVIPKERVSPGTYEHSASGESASGNSLLASRHTETSSLIEELRFVSEAATFSNQSGNVQPRVFRRSKNPLHTEKHFSDEFPNGNIPCFRRSFCSDKKAIKDDDALNTELSVIIEENSSIIPVSIDYSKTANIEKYSKESLKENSGKSTKEKVFDESNRSNADEAKNMGKKSQTIAEEPESFTIGTSESCKNSHRFPVVYSVVSKSQRFSDPQENSENLEECPNILDRTYEKPKTSRNLGKTVKVVNIAAAPSEECLDTIYELSTATTSKRSSQVMQKKKSSELNLQAENGNAHISMLSICAGDSSGNAIASVSGGNLEENSESTMPWTTAENSYVNFESTVSSSSGRNSKLRRQNAFVHAHQSSIVHSVDCADSSDSNGVNLTKSSRRWYEKIFRTPNALKRVWRGMRFDKLPSNSFNANNSIVESVSLSVGPRVPVGHSTLANAEFSRPSSIYRNGFTAQYGDPWVERINVKNVQGPRGSSASSDDDQPLDLSTRFNFLPEEENKTSQPDTLDERNSSILIDDNNLSNKKSKKTGKQSETNSPLQKNRQETSNVQENNNEKKRNVSHDNDTMISSYREINQISPLLEENNNISTANFNDVFCETNDDFWRVSDKISSSSEQGVMRSDSIKFYHDHSKSCVKCEKENVTPKLLEKSRQERRENIVKDLKMHNSHTGFAQKLAKIFHRRSKSADLSARSGKTLEFIPVKFQRDSAEMSFKSDKSLRSKNSKFFRRRLTPSDLELGFILYANEEDIGPCTEL